MSRSLAEIEFDLRRELYNQQVVRRDAVRGTLAVPFAIISFAAFGFNGLRLSLSLDWTQPALQFLSFWGLALAALSGFFFIWALTLGRFLDYSTAVPLPEIVDLERQEDEVRRDYESLGFDQDMAQDLARDASWNALSEEYSDLTARLAARNGKNLDLQAEMLIRLFLGLGLLIAAILIFHTTALLKSEYFGIETTARAAGLILPPDWPIFAPWQA